MKELWRSVVGFEGLYQVSNLGKVMTVEREYFSGRNHKIKKTVDKAMMHHRINKHGYIDVSLRNAEHRRPFTVHRLVYEAFVESIPDGLVINHKDLNKVNNRIDNLEAITIRENNHHYLNSTDKKCKSIGVRSQGIGFVSQIANKGHRIYLGYFSTEEEASEYYQAAYKDIVNNRKYTFVSRRGGPRTYALL